MGRDHCAKIQEEKMKRFKVSLTRCTGYEVSEVEKSLKSGMDLVGGIGSFIKPGEKVLIKPNLLMEARPEQAITTHPEVIRAVIRLVKTVTDRVFCGDSPSIWGEKRQVEEVYESTGLSAICRQEKAELAYFTAPRLVKGYALTEWMFDCDRLINLPKFKTHGLTVLTAGVKNLFGLVVGMHKMKIHMDCPDTERLAKALVDIYQIRPPDLTILDAIVAMEGQGPGTAGVPRKMNFLAVSTDALALDSVLPDFVGISQKTIVTNRIALERGLEAAEREHIDVVGEAASSFAVSDFCLPKTSFLSSLPAWLAGILKVLLRMRVEPDISRCKVCGVCVKSCPAKALSIQEGRLSVDTRSCIYCLCCIEVCPYNAMKVTKNFFLRILNR